MKRSLLVLAAIALLALVAAPIASAYSQIPTEDAWVDATQAFNTTSLQVQSSFSGTGCAPVYTTYLKWDLSTIEDTKLVGTVNLSLKVLNSPLPSLGSTSKLALFGVADDGWTEGTLNTVRPAPGALALATIPLDPAAPPASNSTITFPSSTDLVDFVKAQLVDNQASFAVRIIDCSAGVSNIRFYSSESAGNEPQLELLDPTAVTMTKTSAERVSFPLYAGLGAVALILVAGLAISRRRTA